MNFTILKTSILLFLVFFNFSCTKDTTQEKDYEDTEFNAFSKIEREILTLVNDHRKKLGVSTLKMHQYVYAVAGRHNDFMINELDTISHIDYKKRASHLREKIGSKAFGENLAIGYTTAEAVFQGWLESNAHRETIERDGYNYTGISVKQNEKGRYFYTHLFVKK